MSLKRSVDPIATAVVDYCDAIEVPDVDAAAIDAAAIVSRRRGHAVRKRRFRKAPLRIGVCVAATAALLIVVFNLSAVVAEMSRVFEAFTVAAGKTTPMTIRVVAIDRARKDMPFAVIEPPPIPGAPVVTVEEMYGPASRSNASVIFEIHGATPGREVMIVENRADRPVAATLLTIRGPGNRELPRMRPLESRVFGRPAAAIVLHGSSEGEAFSPTTWVTHGTRVAVMSPPGLLTDLQMNALRRAMSR